VSFSAFEKSLMTVGMGFSWLQELPIFNKLAIDAKVFGR